jgi:hypothetical protein
MPFIQAHIAAGLTHAQKRRLIHEIVAVTSEAIGSDPKIINVSMTRRTCAYRVVLLTIATTKRARSVL